MQLNYQRVYDIVKSQMEMKSHLLEHIAGRILDAIYAEMEGIQKAYSKGFKDESSDGREDRFSKCSYEQVRNTLPVNLLMQHLLYHGVLPVYYMILPIFSLNISIIEFLCNEYK